MYFIFALSVLIDGHLLKLESIICLVLNLLRQCFTDAHHCLQNHWYVFQRMLALSYVPCELHTLAYIAWFLVC